MIAPAPRRGVLHLVVGPSGAGKDTLIDRARLARPDIFFPVRTVTRAADAGGEVHDAVSDAEFDARAGRGEFILWWGAHGLRYGVPRAAADALAAGRHVVVNVSRAAVAEARTRFVPLRVLVVTAPAAILAARIAARGRESADDVAARLARAAPAPEGPDVTLIDNGGSLDAAVAAFLAALAPPAAPGAG